MPSNPYGEVDLERHHHVWADHHPGPAVTWLEVAPKLPHPAVHLHGANSDDVVAEAIGLLDEAIGLGHDTDPPV